MLVNRCRTFSAHGLTSKPWHLRSRTAGLETRRARRGKSGFGPVGQETHDAELGGRATASIDGGPAPGYNGLMRVLGLDLGKRRVGVAVSDPDGTIARPLVQFRVQGRAGIVETVRRLVAEQGASRVVVGLPLHANGERGEQVRWTEGVVAALAEALQVPVETWDERFSTEEAEDILARSGRRGRDRKGRRDMVAAAVILQDYLDAQQG